MLKNLKDFANAIFDAADWPEGGDIDMLDFQDAAVKYGLLVPETRFEPCGEYCNCLEYYTKKEMAQGITCYRKAEWLAISNLEAIAWHLEQGEDNGGITKEALAAFLRDIANTERGLTTDAPEMTVGDSGSVSEDSTDEPCPTCNGKGF